MFVIFDLDGTLSLAEHRRHYLEKKPKDWDAFYAACDMDAPNVPIIRMLNSFVEQHHVEIWSGRREAERDKTIAWFAAHDCMFEGVMRLRMRPDKDHRPDDILKAEWLDTVLADDFPPDLVFDDRDRMVAMWRARGIVCCQVAPGNF